MIFSIGVLPAGSGGYSIFMPKVVTCFHHPLSVFCSRWSGSGVNHIGKFMVSLDMPMLGMDKRCFQLLDRLIFFALTESGCLRNEAPSD